MSISTPFVRRPVGTTLLSVAIALAGILGFHYLPVAPLPQVDFPVIQVSAGLPGASPETMASAVATPLERQFGRIAGVNEMTSSSSLGSTRIVLQFDLNRNIDAAARDVQAAINAAADNLPSNLPGLPRYRKANPADAPVLILALTSDIYDRGQMYDAASTILQQKISQVDGVGQVTVGGGTLPAVRVDVNPTALNNLGLGLDDVRAALASANANLPKGRVEDNRYCWTINASDQLLKAAQYRPLIIAYRKGAAVRLSDVATVTDSVEDTRVGGLANGKPSVALIIFRQPGANIIQTVDRVLALMPQLQAAIPPGMKLAKLMDRTTTIRASVTDTELTMMISVLLVILVVFVFLRDFRTTLIPSVAVPISLIGTFGVMYFLGYSIDNLSLMALTISTGFVVDDAIVVIENITRYIEQDMPPVQAALRGAREIGFTVVSMSLSLIAVFIPILLMGGIVGRLFREFAVTLSIAVSISLLVSLTTTPMMCATLLRHRRPEEHGRIYHFFEAIFNGTLRTYESILTVVLRHPAITLLITLITIALNVYLYIAVPKELFPQQDAGRLSGRIIADQGISSGAMKKLMSKFATATSNDPAVENVVAFISSGTYNTGMMFVMLKPLNERKLSGDQVIARLRRSTAHIAGARLFFQAQQDLRIGGRMGNAQYQYTLYGDDLRELNEWAPKVVKKMRSLPGLVDVNSDQQNQGLESYLTMDRTTASRVGLSPQGLDDALYDAFGQRQVSTMYARLNQYHVIMEVDPQFSQNPSGLQHIFVHPSSAAPGVQKLIPITTVTRAATITTPLTVNHQSQFPSVTISFNLRPNMSLGTAVTEIDQGIRDLGAPVTIHGTFAGTAQAFRDSLANEPMLILAALAAVYIVLGMLYESLIHPVTILSTLPSAGVGALLALILCNTSLSIIALIGIILLIGIVKKNAIMMIDFAVDAERRSGKSPRDAIFQACLLRFRPITMTTMAAALGGLPLALGTGVGAELRRPLGIAIVGGLIFSQALTLFTTPVIYLYMDRFRWWIREKLLGTRTERYVEARLHE